MVKLTSFNIVMVKLTSFNIVMVKLTSFNIVMVKLTSFNIVMGKLTSFNKVMVKLSLDYLCLTRVHFKFENLCTHTHIYILQLREDVHIRQKRMMSKNPDILWDKGVIPYTFKEDLRMCPFYFKQTSQLCVRGSSDLFPLMLVVLID